MSKIELTEEQKREELAELIELYGEEMVKNVVDEAAKRKADEEAKEILENAEFNLDAALDSYDPTFPRYNPSKDAFEFFILMRLVQGGDFEFDTPIAHYFMVDMLLGHIKDPMQFPYSEEVCKQITIDKNAIGFMASRGLAKSTIGISFFGVYSAIKGKLPNDIGDVWFYLLIAASSKGGARVNALAVKAMCEESKYLKDYFEDMRFTETESEFIRKDPTGNAPKKDRSFLIRYQGLNTGIRGSRYGERRPCCHVKGTEVTTEYGTYKVENHPGPKSVGHWELCKEVAVRGLPNTEIVSTDHKYFAKLCVAGKCVEEVGKKLSRYSEHPAKWVEANALTDRHWIGEYIDYSINPIQSIEYTIRDGVSSRNELGQLQGPAYKTGSKVHPHMLDTEWWWAYGLWLGDGSLGSAKIGREHRYNRGTIAWCIADTQRETVGKKLITLLKRLGVNYREVKTTTQQRCYTITISDTALADWLRLQKSGNSKKTMPEWVLTIELEKQRQLLLGYIAADGYIDKNKRSSQIRINSVHYKVLRQLQIISSRLGLPTHIRNTKQAGTQTWFNGVTCDHNHQWELRLKENVGSTLGIEGVENSARVKFKQVHIADGLLWRQVKEVKDTEEEYELIPIQCNNKNLAKKCGTVHAYSTEFGISKNCLLFDDTILNTAAAYSKIMSDNLHTILHSDAVNALKGGGKGRVLLYFTPFHYGDVNTRAILNGSFTPVVIPMAKAFDAEDPNLRATDIVSSWEAMHPRVSIVGLIKRARKAKELKLFLQERMLRLTSGSERLIPDNCLQFCDMKVIEDNIEAYNIYITTDYTTTSGEKSDFSGIATWAVSSNEDWFLLNLHLRKMGMDTQYALTLEEAAKYKRKGKNVEIGVEVDGNQAAHVNALEKLMRDQGTYYSFAKQKGHLDSTRKGILSKNSGLGAKHERFRVASQVMLKQKMWFPKHLENTPDMIEFIAQLKGVTHETFTRSDDGPDLITMALVTMHVYYPTYEAVTAKMVTPDGMHYFSADKNNSYSAYDSY